MVLKLLTEIEVKLSIMPTVRAKRGNGERSESNRPPFGYRTLLEMKLLPLRLKRDHLLKRNPLIPVAGPKIDPVISFQSLSAVSRANGSEYRQEELRYKLDFLKPSSVDAYHLVQMSRQASQLRLRPQLRHADVKKYVSEID